MVFVRDGRFQIYVKSVTQCVSLPTFNLVKKIIQLWILPPPRVDGGISLLKRPHKGRHRAANVSTIIIIPFRYARREIHITYLPPQAEHQHVRENDGKFRTKFQRRGKDRVLFEDFFHNAVIILHVIGPHRVEFLCVCRRVSKKRLVILTKGS